MLRTWMKQARLLLATSLALNVAFANGDIGTYECRVVQLDAQETVTAGEPYRNLGQRTSTAARYIDAAVSQEQITPDCAGCIISEFAKNKPIAEQTPCGPLVDLKLESVPSEIALILGETKNLVTVVGIETNEVTQAVEITLTQSGGTSGGIQVFPFFEFEVYMGSGGSAKVFNQEISGLTVGTYELVTTANLPGFDKQVTARTEIIVREEEPSGITLSAPMSWPLALKAGKVNDVIFTVALDGRDRSTVESVTLVNPETSDLIHLNNDGLDGDVLAGDTVWSGTAVIDTSGITPGMCQKWIASGYSGGQAYYSSVFPLCVTEFPIGVSEDESVFVAHDSETGLMYYADEALVMFSPPLPKGDVSSALKEHQAQVVGTLPMLDGWLYQIRFDSAAIDYGDYLGRLGTLVADPRVFSAVPHSILSTSAVYYDGSPDDPLFPQQPEMMDIRAPEAWYFSRGEGQLIAIIDTGIWADHPDLGSKKVILGKDYVDKNGVGADEAGHGTFVAGLAAAVGNNKEGIAGVAWEARLLNMRISTGGDGISSALSNFAGAMRLKDAMKTAAAQGARVINVSFAKPAVDTFDIFLCGVIKDLRAQERAVVVASAGNDPGQKKAPAGCNDAIAVGNLMNLEQRHPTSGFGDWVDLAARGTNVSSTVPLGPCRKGAIPGCSEAGYLSGTGASYSTPIVAGAVAVLLSQGIALRDVEQRLKGSAVPLMKSQRMGAGRIDLMEALFGGGFEDPQTPGWSARGSAASVPSLGPIVPRDRERMGYASTGPADAFNSGSLTQRIRIRPDVLSLPIELDYAFVSQEYPEFVGTIFNDSMKISASFSGGKVVLAYEEVNSAGFYPISGIDFVGGDETTGWTRWKRTCNHIAIPRPVAVDGSDLTLDISVSDAGDRIYDSVVLVDRIRFRPCK